MGDPTSGKIQIGTQASPISLGATGGGTDVGTYTHGLGQKALTVQLFDPVNGGPITERITGELKIVVTQPDENTIVFTHGAGSTITAIAIVTWEISTPGKAQQVAASDVVLS